MADINLVYPGGAGGNWLSNLVYCLEYNMDPAQVSVNYHRSPGSYSIKLTHDTSVDRPCFFNGRGLFNIYLNVVHKLRIHQMQLDTAPIPVQCDTLANEASSKLSFIQSPRDLDWNNIFLGNTSLFIDQLFGILDTNKIRYTKNVEICKTAIGRYRATCVYPAEYYNNWDSIIWLGWCNGVSKHLFNSYITAQTKDELKDFLYPKKDFFRHYTTEYTLYYIL